MIEAIKEVLKGIDQTELESTDGWWETSAGAEFGAKKLKYILGLLAQPEQEPVAWRYKPVRENNPRWEYTTNHPLDMGDGYLRPTLVEYCKCIEPLYAKEKPKLMLEKFREMKDLLDAPTLPQRTWVGLPESAFAGMTLQQVTAMKYAEQILKDQNT